MVGFAFVRILLQLTVNSTLQASAAWKTNIILKTTSKQKENTRKLSFSENVSKNKDINLPRDQNPRSVIH